jgi:hypothetical protein
MEEKSNVLHANGLKCEGCWLTIGKRFVVEVMVRSENSDVLSSSESGMKMVGKKYSLALRQKELGSKTF